MGIPSRSTNTIKGDLDARDEQMKSRTSAGYENTASQLTENVEAVLNMDEPFLHPIDEPSDPAVEQAYQNMKQYFGKVMMPARVFNSRMPIEFLQFYTQISMLDQKLELEKEMVMLIRQQVARINVCLFCIDSNRAATIWASMNQAKFDALDRYQTNPLFSEAERAALDFVTTLTKEKKVDPKTFAKLLEHYSEHQICEIVYLVASEHTFNMTNIGLHSF